MPKASSTDPVQAFDQLLHIDNLFEWDGAFYDEAVPNFYYRMQSLYRYWVLQKLAMQAFTSSLASPKLDGSAEHYDVYSEIGEVDLEFFPEYLRLSTLSVGLSLIENLLRDLSEAIAKQQGIRVDLPRKAPYFNRYLHWLCNGAGVEINLDSTTWKNLDAMRRLRNRFVHEINKDIPEHVKEVISEMVGATETESVTDEFVERSFEQLADLAEQISLAVTQYYESRPTP